MRAGESIRSDGYVASRQIRIIGLAGWGVMAAAYTTIFYIFNDAGMLSAMQRALINTVPAALLSFPIVKILEDYVIERGLVKQALAHFILAVAFSVLWYVGLQVGYGLRDGWMSAGISGRPLLGIALTWQAFQSVTIYAVIALFAYAAFYRKHMLVLQRKLTELKNASVAPIDSPAQLLVKTRDGIIPVKFSDVIALSGAGDYVQVQTRRKALLTTKTLNQFVQDLPTRQFLRIHRSHIVQIDAILSAESSGDGRLILHLPRGLSLTTSRAGAKRVRELSA